MRSIVCFLVVVLLPLAAVGSTLPPAQDYGTAIAVFQSSPAVQPFFDDSYGYAVFPTVAKGGFIFGVGYGPGQVYRHGQVTGKTSIIEGSVGFQVGIKTFRQIIFFRDKTAYDDFTSGSFEFDASVQAVIITAAADAQAGTGSITAGATITPQTGAQAKSRYVNGIAVFLHTLGGIMGELSVGGQRFGFEPL